MLGRQLTPITSQLGMAADSGPLGAVASARVLAGVAAAVFVGVRAVRGPQLRQREDVRELLERRLASGEISSDEFYELDSALRSGARGRR
jgi:uncharacterized membrane protein